MTDLTPERSPARVGELATEPMQVTDARRALDTLPDGQPWPVTLVYDDDGELVHAKPWTQAQVDDMLAQRAAASAADTTRADALARLEAAAVSDPTIADLLQVVGITPTADNKSVTR